MEHLYKDFYENPRQKILSVKNTQKKNIYFTKVVDDDKLMK